VASRQRSVREAREELVNLNARVPKGLWRRVRLRCLTEEKLLRTFITEALEEYLQDQRRSRS